MPVYIWLPAFISDISFLLSLRLFNWSLTNDFESKDLFFKALIRVSVTGSPHKAVETHPVHCFDKGLLNSVPNIRNQNYF